MASKYLNKLINNFPSIGRLFTTAAMSGFEDLTTLKVNLLHENICHVQLNRPEKLNAMNRIWFRECKDCFHRISSDSRVRCVILSGEGRIFCSGLDLKEPIDIFSKLSEIEDVARKAAKIREYIVDSQEAISSLEKCPKPIICAIHSACIGGGVDLVTSGDIRLATEDAYFQIKEVDIGLAADIGTLQRFQKIVGNDSLFRELAFSGRRLTSSDALKLGLVSAIYADKESMLSSALELAKEIASKSPIAVQTTKVSINYSRDHTVSESLRQIADVNMVMLQSEDIMKSVMATLSKEKPIFSKL